MKVTVDPDRCQGHARCWEICPEIFPLNDEGFANPADTEIPTEFTLKAKEAAANCPERAITIH